MPPLAEDTHTVVYITHTHTYIHTYAYRYMVGSDHCGGKVHVVYERRGSKGIQIGF